jgi:hypothetical protein
MDADVHPQTPVDWRKLYRAALLELDPAADAVLIQKAEQALCARLHQLGDDACDDERRAINDALHALNDLRSNAA